MNSVWAEETGDTSGWGIPRFSLYLDSQTVLVEMLEWWAIEWNNANNSFPSPINGSNLFGNLSPCSAHRPRRQASIIHSNNLRESPILNFAFGDLIKLDSTSYLQSVFYLQPDTGCFQLFQNYVFADLWKICKFWYWIINIWFVLSLQFEWNIFRDNPQTVLQKYFADAVFGGVGRLALAGALAGLVFIHWRAMAGCWHWQEYWIF